MHMLKIPLDATAVALSGRLAAAGAARARRTLVSTDWLAANLGNPSIRVIEVKAPCAATATEATIPGAATLAWHTDLVDPRRHAIVSKRSFEALLSDAGVAEDSTVVIYDDHDNWFAAWALWVFGVYGVKDVRILDGGRRKWLEECRVLDTAHNRTTTRFRADRINTALRARLSDMLALIDGRSPSGGAIEPRGATTLYRGAGGRAVVYCRLGEPSSHSWFALSKLLDYDLDASDEPDVAPSAGAGAEARREDGIARPCAWRPEMRRPSFNFASVIGKDRTDEQRSRPA